MILSTVVWRPAILRQEITFQYSENLAMSLSEQKPNPTANQLVKDLEDSLVWEGVSENTHNAIEETLLFLVAMYNEPWHEHGSNLLELAKTEVSAHLKREETPAEYWERVLHQNRNDNQPQE